MPSSWEQRSSLEDLLVPKVTVNMEGFLLQLFHADINQPSRPFGRGFAPIESSPANVNAVRSRS
jgi:hypothetical protein